MTIVPDFMSNRNESNLPGCMSFLAPFWVSPGLLAPLSPCPLAPLPSCLLVAMAPCAGARDMIMYETKVELCADVDSTKADSDNKSYRLMKLENGLRALLVHDPTATAISPDASTGWVDTAVVCACGVMRSGPVRCGAVRFVFCFPLRTCTPCLS